MNTQENIQKAKVLLEECNALFITAGAGMGVYSSLPDFRGVEGFWQAYPKAKELGLHFEEMANPEWFESNPRLAWAFCGHRLHLYRDTIPHEGFSKLLGLSNTKKYGAHIFTSNDDGQFQKAGFKDEHIVECHGSVDYLQCLDNCQATIWSIAARFDVPLIRINPRESFGAELGLDLGAVSALSQIL